MKIAISCTGRTLEDELDPRFGRAAFFLIVDSATDLCFAIDNSSREASGGAGIAAAQTMIDQGVKAVLTGQLGPNALNVLSSARIEAYQGIPGAARDSLLAFRSQELKPIRVSGPSHAGIGDAGHPGGRA